MKNIKVTEKRCRNCNETKPASEFNKHYKSSDGLQSYCRECQRETSKKNASLKRGPSKKCSICKRNKSHSCFGKDRTHNDGLKSSCKVCRNKQVATRKKIKSNKTTGDENMSYKIILNENDQPKQDTLLTAVEQTLIKEPETLINKLAPIIESVLERAKSVTVNSDGAMTFWIGKSEDK